MGVYHGRLTMRMPNTLRQDMAHLKKDNPQGRAIVLYVEYVLKACCASELQGSGSLMRFQA